MLVLYSWPFKIASSSFRPLSQKRKGGTCFGSAFPVVNSAPCFARRPASFCETRPAFMAGSMPGGVASQIERSPAECGAADRSGASGAPARCGVAGLTAWSTTGARSFPSLVHSAKPTQACSSGRTRCNRLSVSGRPLNGRSQARFVVNSAADCDMLWNHQARVCPVSRMQSHLARNRRRLPGEIMISGAVNTRAARTVFALSR